MVVKTASILCHAGGFWLPYPRNNTANVTSSGCRKSAVQVGRTKNRAAPVSGVPQAGCNEDYGCCHPGEAFTYAKHLGSTSTEGCAMSPARQCQAAAAPQQARTLTKELFKDTLCHLHVSAACASCQQSCCGLCVWLYAQVCQAGKLLHGFLELALLTQLLDATRHLLPHLTLTCCCILLLFLQCARIRCESCQAPRCCCNLVYA